MRMILRLAMASLRARGVTAALTVFSIALSVALLLGVERAREMSRSSFVASVSGTDLIVGARTSPVHLLLFSVFHVGRPAANLKRESADWLAAHPRVAWTIPVSLGDSHRGVAVVGTSAALFEHYRYGPGKALAFARGGAFSHDLDAVLGAETAASLGYDIGQPLVLAHGAGDLSFTRHEGQPFRVTGILAPTGTPVDRTVLVGLRGIDRVHEAGTANGDDDPLAVALRSRGGDLPTAQERGALSAVLVGLRARRDALALQRVINETAPEPLTAILPVPTLQEVWEIAGVAERALLAVSSMVVVVGLTGMLVALLTSVAERRREMAVLRAVGARPAHVFVLVLSEAALLTGAGVALGTLSLQGFLALGREALRAQFGMTVDTGWPSLQEWQLLLSVALAGILAGVIPAWRLTRLSLADGMTVRV
ncbi:MAG: ABC transporter permease [Betaproteobacteria bacterium]